MSMPFSDMSYKLEKWTSEITAETPFPVRFLLSKMRSQSTSFTDALPTNRLKFYFKATAWGKCSLLSRLDGRCNTPKYRVETRNSDFESVGQVSSYLPSMLR